MDVVETHPGLEFLRSAPEFHSRYVTTLGTVQNFRFFKNRKIRPVIRNKAEALGI